MIYNVVLCSKITKLPVRVLTGFDNRPLRFTEFRYALKAAEEENMSLKDEEHIFLVIEEKNR